MVFAWGVRGELLTVLGVNIGKGCPVGDAFCELGDFWTSVATGGSGGAC